MLSLSFFLSKFYTRNVGSFPKMGFEIRKSGSLLAHTLLAQNRRQERLRTPLTGYRRDRRWIVGSQSNHSSTVDSQHVFSPFGKLRTVNEIYKPLLSPPLPLVSFFYIIHPFTQILSSR